jgi:hypothetical protein
MCILFVSEYGTGAYEEEKVEGVERGGPTLIEN